MPDALPGDAAGRTVMDDDLPCAIEPPYLLAINITLIRAQDGRYFADHLWVRDLWHHVDHIRDLTLFSPVRDGVPGEGDDPLPGAIRVVGYSDHRSVARFVAGLPRLLPKLAREVDRATIVHSAVAGWPMPLGWFAAPLARRADKLLVINVESAFWRLTPGVPAHARQKLRAWLSEVMARRCLRKADYATYTQPAYRDSLPAPRAVKAEVIQASWISEDDIVTESSAIAAWVRKLSTPLRLLFAGRLIPEKGTGVLVAALKRLAAADADIFIDIIGQGPAEAELAAVAADGWGARHVGLLQPVPYGRPFFDLLGGYHAVLVPSLSDEQPRIVYDAYAQAVPVVASDGPGLRSCVSPETGALFPSGDVDGLVALLQELRADPGRLRAAGLAGLKQARVTTHAAFHRRRCRDLNEILARTGAA